MAKITGPQTVPAEWLNAYRSNLTDPLPDGTVRKRFPYRLPKCQEGGLAVTDEQKKQRGRVKFAVGLFKTIPPAGRTRWWDNMPPWGSFLWYYNYFIMSALVGNADPKRGGAGVIKSIQFKTIAMPAGAGEGSVAIAAVDPTRAVVMLYGNSIAIDDEGGVYFVTTVYPYVSEITAELVKCKWSLATPYYTNTKAANIGITVIEYI